MFRATPTKDEIGDEPAASGNNRIRTMIIYNASLVDCLVRGRSS